MRRWPCRLRRPGQSSSAPRRPGQRRLGHRARRPPRASSAALRLRSAAPRSAMHGKSSPLRRPRLPVVRR
eukprot:2161029-Alexandrium_andersonii.AAC.1